MPETTQEASALTPEHQQRTHATITAGDILRRRGAAKGFATPGEAEPGLMEEIVDLANYIVTGEHPREFEARTSPVRVIHGLPLPPGDYDVTPRPVKDTPQAEEAPVSPAIIRDMLLVVQASFDAEMPTVEDIQSWDQQTRKQVVLWASAVHLRASDNDVEIPRVPNVLRYSSDIDFD